VSVKTPTSVRRQPAGVERGSMSKVRAVLLLTIDVPFDERAVGFAVDTAVETSAQLFVCDAVPIRVANPAVAVSRTLGEKRTRREADRIVRQARARGARASQLVFHNPNPIRAVIEVIKQENIGLLVFGPDRAELGNRRFLSNARRLREGAACLVWTNE